MFMMSRSSVEQGRILRLRSAHVRWFVLARDLVVSALVLPAAAFPIGLLSVGQPIVFAAGMVVLCLAALAGIAHHATNWVTIEVTRTGDLVVRDGLLVHGTVSVAAAAVQQIFSSDHSWVEGAERRNRHAGVRVSGVRMLAKLSDGRDIRLASGILPADASAIEREIEAFLGIRDVPMLGGKR